jgi:uncharacterized membrane protein YfcA
MLEISFLIMIVIIAFVAEYIDSTLGGGYGTLLTPLLLLFGFSAVAVVPAILLSELFTGAFAAFSHHKVGNVSFDFKNDEESEIVKRLGKLGYMPKSIDSKIAIVLALCSTIGGILAVFIAVSISKSQLNFIIGSIVLVMGILILMKRKTGIKFSWKKIVSLGALASFNKSLSGGGYGPLVTSGQILSGVNSKSSIAITSFSESFTCLVGLITYIALGKTINWSIAPFLMAGALMSVPLSAYSVKRMNTDKFTLIVGIAIIILGVTTLLNMK